MVRNGVDTLRACLLHHLSLGCERIHVVDNGSTDGTAAVLKRLAGRTPITWSRDTGAYQQHEVVTELVRQAAREGADWVVPFDHDEFWVSERPLHAALAAATGGGVGAVEVPMVNFAQRRDGYESGPRALLTMQYRAAETIEPIAAQALVEAEEISFLEYRYPPKLIFRASERVDVQRGAHWSKSLEGPVIPADGIENLHAPLLTRETLRDKAEHGDRLVEAGFIDREGWHVRRWAQMAREGRLDDDWAAVSVDADGCVLVGGERRPFVRDNRLSAAVLPYVRSRARQTVARALRRSY